VSVREDTIIAAITAFLDQYVFGYDRAAMLAARIPASTAEHAAARAREHARLTAELARIDTAQAGLFTELEQLGADTSPATQAYRGRIRARHSDYHDQRTTHHPDPARRPHRRRHPQPTTPPCSTNYPTWPPPWPAPPPT
jgi:hypothetical protein